MEPEVKIEVSGDLVIQTITSTVERDKAQYLQEKLDELEAHDKGVEEYIKARAEQREILVNLIEQLK